MLRKLSILALTGLSVVLSMAPANSYPNQELWEKLRGKGSDGSAATTSTTPSNSATPSDSMAKPGSMTKPSDSMSKPGSMTKPSDSMSKPGSAMAAEGTVVDVAIKAGSFKTLAAALEAAGLVETLKGKGPFTVFAPTDEAFAALPKGTLEDLLKPENKSKLVKILTYHVIPAEALSTSLKSGDVKTVEGGTVAIKVDGGKVTVNAATVTKADIKASNGVIHVIDKVLLPPS